MTLATTAPDAGGVLRHVLDLAECLRELGHDVAIASRCDALPVVKAVLNEDFVWLPLWRSTTVAADVWHLHLANTLDRRALPLIAARRVRSRGVVVMTEHLPRNARTDFVWPASLGPKPKGRPGAATARLLMKRAECLAPDAVIAVSHASAHFMSHRWKVDPKRFTVIHNGVRLPEMPPEASRGGTPMRVVGVAKLHWLKGFDILLDAAALANEPWSIELIGEGFAQEDLKASAARLDDTHPVTFAGWRPNAADGALEGDVLCAPSRAESFSYVILEAMARARPVVAAAVDGAREAVADGETGMLVPPEDPQRLADALDRLAREPALRLRMGSAARERVAAEFSADLMTEKTVALYNRAQSSRSGRSGSL